MALSDLTTRTLEKTFGENVASEVVVASNAAATSVSPSLTGAVSVGNGSSTVGFYGTTPISKPTGAALTALSNLGLIGSPTLAVAAVSGAAPLDSPAFTTTATAPTPTAGDSTTKVATTAFVATSFAPLESPTFTGKVGLSISPSYGLHQLGGAQRLQALATPGAPTVTVNSGSGTDYYYFIVAEDRNTLRSPVGAASTVASSSATPDNTITWTAVPGAVKYYILRYTTNSFPAGANNTLITTWTTGALSKTDTAAAGTSFTAPTRNETADLTVDGGITVGQNITMGSASSTCQIIAGGSGGIKVGSTASDKIGFFGVTPIVQPAVTGIVTDSQGVKDLMQQLHNLGLIVYTPGT